MKQRNAMVWVLAMLLAGTSAAWATGYTWNYAGNDNWGTASQWNPNTGYPGQAAGDTASFTGAVGRTVTVNVTPANVLDSFNVSGTGVWTWAASGVNYLTIGGGNLNYASSVASTSILATILTGSGQIRVTGGALRLQNTNNTFTGDVHVEGGKLVAADTTGRPQPGLLGVANTIYLGSALAGSNDAALYLQGWYDANGIYRQPFIVRSGNDGTATLGQGYNTFNHWNGIDLTNWVTLQKSVTLDTPDPPHYPGKVQRYGGFDFTRGITGTGTVIKTGPGRVELRGASDYVGETIVRGGLLELQGTPNNRGNLRVEFGLVQHTTDAQLGDAANNVVLGSTGALGGIGPYNSATLTRPVRIEGNGAMMVGYNNGAYTVNSPLSGPGRLIFAVGNQGGISYLNGDNSALTGGLDVLGYGTDVEAAYTNKRVYGSGPVRIMPSAYLYVRSTNNIAPGATAMVAGPINDGVGLTGSLILMLDYVPEIHPDSAGYLKLQVNSGPNINTRLAATAAPLGNGFMRLTGSATATFTGASLQPNADGRYRFGTLQFDRPGSTEGVLTGTNGLQVGRVYEAATVHLFDANTYSGETLVDLGSSVYGYAQTGAGASPFGATTDAVRLNGGGIRLVGTNGGQAVTKGLLSVQGDAFVQLRETGGGGTPTLSFSQLERVGRAALNVTSLSNYLGGASRVFALSGVPAASNGMLPPWLRDTSNGYFLNYDSAYGFTNATFVTPASLAAAGVNDIVNLTSDQSVKVGGQTIHALKTSGAVSGGVGDVLTVGSGGVWLTGVKTHSAPFAFGSTEAVFTVAADNTLSGVVSGDNGLTVSGGSILRLSNVGNQGQLSGTVTVNGATLYATNSACLGGLQNPIVLNGGTLIPNSGVTVISNNITLGAAGGTVKFGRIFGNIGGEGRLVLTVEGSGSYGVYVGGTNNTFTGGTYLTDSGPNPRYEYHLAANSSLGTGPVVLGDGGTAPGGAVLFYVYGDNCIRSNAMVLRSFGSELYLKGTDMHAGSLEGYGHVWFEENRAMSLSVGRNNRSTEFFGWIGPYYWNNSHKLIKVGTGSLTLWGENTYSGGTIVSNGTLVVNNWLNPAGPVLVRPGATLDGIGTLGIVSNQGGTVKGSLYMRQLAMSAASTNMLTINGTNAVSQYGQLHVSEGLTLGGSTLGLTLGVKPLPGQIFTILNNTSGSLIADQFASGRTVSATYNGSTYTFRINYAGGDGNDIVLTLMPRGSVISIR